MNNKLSELVDFFMADVYDYITMEYGELMKNKLKCDTELDIRQHIAMYYLGGNNVPYTAGECIRVYRKHYKEEYNQYGTF